METPHRRRGPARTTSPDSDLSLFSGDYTVARRRFREAAERLGWTLESHPLAERGPGSEALAIDVAHSPGPADAPLLVVSSGIHGVEGFFGSAVQLGALQRAAQRGPDAGTRHLMIHALNPYGFAWRRRVNEDNVDLNRNFLRSGELYAGSPPGYAELDALLNPRRGPSRWEPIRLKLALAIARYGLPAMKQSIASGQYEAAKGLFFGGAGPSPLRTLFGTHLARWIGASSTVVHLDLHTGLGPWGTYQLLIDHPLTAAQERWLHDHMGAGTYQAMDGAGVAYVARGCLGHWCFEQLAGRNYLYAAAEFGTYNPPKVLAALRAENQAHHWGGGDAVGREWAKQRLVEAFCPGSPRWRRRVLDEGIRLVERAAGAMGALQR